MSSSASKKRKVAVTPPIHSITNPVIEDYLQSLLITTSLTKGVIGKIVPTISTRYERKHLENKPSVNSTILIRKSSKRMKSKGEILGPKTDQYKIEETSMGFSWWNNDMTKDQLTQQAYNTSCKLFVNGFNGQLNLNEIAGPKLAYTFVVPFMTQFGLMSSFKTQPNDMMVRETMNELSTMKHCYYTQLHWKKGIGNSSHVNERDWRDNPLLDPTSSMIIEGYLSSLATILSEKNGWPTRYKTSLCSLIETDKAGHQAAHIDDKGCPNQEEKNRPFILHHPLCEEGATLQIWFPNSNNKYSPVFMHIPFGTALLLRGDVYHAGCYGTKGNIRFHANLTPEECVADGREVGILNQGCNERLRETDLPSDTVNSLLLSKNHQQKQFTAKYIGRMKASLPVESFWRQKPEQNGIGRPTRVGYS
jgi:hypothetical protein